MVSYLVAAAHLSLRQSYFSFSLALNNLLWIDYRDPSGDFI